MLGMIAKGLMKFWTLAVVVFAIHSAIAALLVVFGVEMDIGFYDMVVPIIVSIEFLLFAVVSAGYLALCLYLGVLELPDPAMREAKDTDEHGHDDYGSDFD